MTDAATADAPEQPLRAGVVGYGWAGRQHMQGYVDAPGVELVAICGMETDAAEILSAQYPGVATFTQLADLLANAKLDVVSIATPTALHAPMAIAALDAGVHVLSEKPMAQNTEVAQSIGAEHRELLLSPQDYFEALPRLIWQEDEPIAVALSDVVIGGLEGGIQVRVLGESL